MGECFERNITLNGILFIDLGEVRTFEINGTQTIGRDDQNDIVVKHPTVSRHHARIEIVDGLCRFTDFNSRNGTRVNGKSVSGTYPLADGARMRIGHVRAWFFAGMPNKLPRSVVQRDAGIIFKCACGQRLWSGSDTTGMTVTCGGCKKSVEVPGQSQKLESENAATVSGVSMENSSEETNAVVCGVCQWPVEESDHLHTCPSCNLTFHKECWSENKGCSTYGCAEVNTLAPKVEPAVIADEPPIIDTIEPEAPEPIVFAWAHALLALGLISSIVGLLAFGIPPAVVMLLVAGRLLLARQDNKSILIATLFITLLGIAAGVMISRFWWFGTPITDFNFLST